MEYLADNVTSIIKYFFIVACSFYVYTKIINFMQITKAKVFIGSVASVVVSAVMLCLKEIIPDPFRLLLICFLSSLVMTALIKNKFSKAFTIMIFSFGISSIAFTVAAAFSSLLFTLLYPIVEDLLIVLLAGLMHITIIYAFFRIKRFSKGFPFLENKIIGYMGILFSGIVLLIYTLCNPSLKFFTGNTIYKNSGLIAIMLCIIGAIIWMREGLTEAYKEKTRMFEINELNKKIDEHKLELKELNSISFTKSKIIHNFNHKIPLIDQSLTSLLSKNTFDLETVRELSDLHDIVKKMSYQLLGNSNNLPDEVSLQTTEVPFIDNTLRYLQSEANRFNIEFLLTLTGKVTYMVQNIIDKEKLQTLLSDHVKDAIIAINSFAKKSGTIMVNIGVINGYYEVSISDDGMPFEITTLLSLGRRAITTHKDIGGTGIGFMSTFEMLNEYKASLIIVETINLKTVSIRFDNKNQYIIQSHRAHEICSVYENDGRVIIEDIC